MVILFGWLSTDFFMICTTRQWKGNKNFLIHSFFQTFYIWLYGIFSIAYEHWDKKHPLSAGLSALFRGIFFWGFLKALNRTLLKISYLRFYFGDILLQIFLIMELYPYNYRFITKKIGDQIVYSFQ